MHRNIVILGLLFTSLILSCTNHIQRSPEEQAAMTKQIYKQGTASSIGENAYISTMSEDVNAILDGIELSSLLSLTDSVHYEVIEKTQLLNDSIVPSSVYLKLPIETGKNNIYLISIDSLVDQSIICVILANEEFDKNSLYILDFILVNLLSFESKEFAIRPDTFNYQIYGIYDSLIFYRGVLNVIK